MKPHGHSSCSIIIIIVASSQRSNKMTDVFELQPVNSSSPFFPRDRAVRGQIHPVSPIDD